MAKTFKIGMIGGGNMGSAMIGGMLSGQLYGAGEVIACDKSIEARERLERAYGIMTTGEPKEAAADADVVIIAVKPAQIQEVLNAIRGAISPDQIIVSIAAGVAIKKIEEGLISIETAGQLKVTRVMPNTPALVGAAMCALAPNQFMGDEDIKRVREIFDSFGRTEVVNEEMMDVVTGLSGSSPAFVYMLIEAMADAAVAEGMTRSMAYTFAAQTVLGSAKMVLETGEHPGKLKDAVCSPGGTTIRGVLSLEENGFRQAIQSAVIAATERSKELG
ncbi:MAG: pyrroline-5-carboxylate reductase [Lachnospiraceae bacterium]|nr:pyrroline-5-carboxylate reductase [Lachnospiraceae bacterium]